MRSENKSLSELRSVLVSVPQVQTSVRIKKKSELNLIPGYTSLIENISKKLNNKGRVYVRYSGTEPVVRVLIEGENKQLIQTYAKEVSSFLQEHLASG